MIVNVPQQYNVRGCYGDYELPVESEATGLVPCLPCDVCDVVSPVEGQRNGKHRDSKLFLQRQCGVVPFPQVCRIPHGERRHGGLLHTSPFSPPSNAPDIATLHHAAGYPKAGIAGTDLNARASWECLTADADTPFSWNMAHTF